MTDKKQPKPGAEVVKNILDFETGAQAHKHKTLGIPPHIDKIMEIMNKMGRGKATPEDKERLALADIFQAVAMLENIQLVRHVHDAYILLKESGEF